MSDNAFISAWASKCGVFPPSAENPSMEAPPGSGLEPLADARTSRRSAPRWLSRPLLMLTDKLQQSEITPSAPYSRLN